MFTVKTKSSKQIAGVDISSTAVKMIQLSRKNGKYHVEAFGSLPLAETDVIDKNIMQSENVGEILERVTNLAHPNTKQVAIAVPTPVAITKVVEMDADLTEDEREIQIRIDAEQYIPYPLDEVSLDFEVQGKSAKIPNKVDVLLVATRTENVDKRVEVVELAGLTPKVVDVEVYALERAYGLISESLPLGVNVVGVFDIGHTQLTLNAFNKGKIIYTREQAFGLRQLIQEIQNHYGLSVQDAERALLAGTLPDDFQATTLYPFLNILSQQIARALQFFFSSTPYSELDHVLLIGGGANLNGLINFLQDELGYRVTIANPFLRMSFASQVDVKKIEKNASSLMTACGLALRGFD